MTQPNSGCYQSAECYPAAFQPPAAAASEEVLGVPLEFHVPVQGTVVPPQYNHNAPPAPLTSDEAFLLRQEQQRPGVASAETRVAPPRRNLLQRLDMHSPSDVVRGAIRAPFVVAGFAIAAPFRILGAAHRAAHRALNPDASDDYGSAQRVMDVMEEPRYAHDSNRAGERDVRPRGTQRRLVRCEAYHEEPPRVQDTTGKEGGKQ